MRSGRQHQPVVGERLAGGERHDAGLRVDALGSVTDAQVDAVRTPPRIGLQFEVRFRHFAGKERGEQHAVVGRMRLGADDADVEAVGRPAAELFHQPGRRHAVADDDDALAHGCHAASTKRWRS